MKLIARKKIVPLAVITLFLLVAPAFATAKEKVAWCAQ